MQVLGEGGQYFETLRTDVTTPSDPDRRPPANGDHLAVQLDKVVVGSTEDGDPEESVVVPAVTDCPLQNIIGECIPSPSDDEEQIVRRWLVAEDFAGRESNGPDNLLP